MGTPPTVPTKSSLSLVWDVGRSRGERRSVGTAVPARRDGRARPRAAFLLAEAAADQSPIADPTAAVDSLEGVADVAVAVDQPRRDALWHHREDHPTAINSLGPVKRALDPDGALNPNVPLPEPGPPPELRVAHRV